MFVLYFFPDYRILLILPETGLNIFGTMWAFCGTIECKSEDKITRTVIEGKMIYRRVGRWVAGKLIASKVFANDERGKKLSF